MTKRPSAIKVKVKKPYVERPFCGEMSYVIYNAITGNIVATFYNYSMAAMLLEALRNSKTYQDTYEVGEVYDDED